MANQTASLPSPHDVSYCRTCKGDIFLITVNEWERYFGHALSTGKDKGYEASGTSCSQAPYLSRTKVPGQTFALRRIGGVEAVPDLLNGGDVPRAGIPAPRGRVAPGDCSPGAP